MNFLLGQKGLFVEAKMLVSGSVAFPNEPLRIQFSIYEPPSPSFLRWLRSEKILVVAAATLNPNATANLNPMKERSKWLLPKAQSCWNSHFFLFLFFFPKQFTVGFTLKKKRGVHRLARACSVGRGLGVAWAWLGRAWLGRGVGVAWAWLGRGVGVAWARLGRAWLGRGVGVAWAWRGRGLGVAWAWRGRGLGVAWAKDLVMLLWGSMGCFSGAVAQVLWGQRHWLPPPPTTKTISPGVIPNSVLEFHSGTPWMKRFWKKFTGLSTIYVSLFKRKESINVWSCHRPAMKIQ